jgi:hypothetical protein
MFCSVDECLLPTVEDCENEIDDDADNLTDCADNLDCPAGTHCDYYSVCYINLCTSCNDVECGVDVSCNDCGY